MIGVSIILAVVILLLALQFATFGYDPTLPDIFKISRIQYTLSSDGINYIGLIVVMNSGTGNIRNRYVKVNTYVNDNPQDCRIPTLNNDLFCSSDHTGVARLYGVGTWGNKNSPLSVWPAKSEISIEYKKGKMRPGDRVTLEFIDTNTGQIISRDTYPHSETHDAQWFYHYFLSHSSS